MNITKAIRIKTIVVEDPDSNATVEAVVFKDPDSGSIFAVDATFIDQVSVYVPSIFNSGTLQLDEDDEAGDRNERGVPISRWPDSDITAEDREYGVTITVDVSAASFEEARQTFLKAIATGAAETAIFHIEHLKSGIIRELN